MRATAIPQTWRANAVALAMGLAIIGLGAALAHSQTIDPAQPVATQPAQQAAASGFVCHAAPGAWCDLRDWSGFGAPSAASLQPQ